MTPYSTAAAEVLIRHLKLTARTRAEVQDLYSRQTEQRVMEPDVVPLDAA